MPWWLDLVLLAGAVLLWVMGTNSPDDVWSVFQKSLAFVAVVVVLLGGRQMLLEALVSGGHLLAAQRLPFRRRPHGPAGLNGLGAKRHRAGNQRRRTSAAQANLPGQLFEDGAIGAQSRGRGDPPGDTRRPPPGRPTRTAAARSAPRAPLRRGWAGTPFACRWRRASNSSVAAATDTLSDCTIPRIGITIAWSIAAAAAALSPHFSAPSTKAVGPLKSQLR